MPRTIGSESSRTTLFQLEALTSAVTHGGFSAAANDLGISDKHRLIKAVERLADTLKIEGLSNRIGDELTLPVQLQNLEPSASRVLAAIQEFQQVITLQTSKTAIVRCVTYPSLVVTFLSRAVNSFESDTHRDAHKHVQFVNLDSRNRRESGAALVRTLQAKLADIAFGQTSVHPLGDDNIESQRLFKWYVVAAIHGNHELRDEIEEVDGLPVINIAKIVSHPLLLSPRGHRSRDLLTEDEPPMGFQIDLESDNTQARAALGRSGKRVPLIASDALTDGEFDSTWPIVGVKTGRKWKLLGDSHSVYWRKDLPEFISQAVGSFVDHALTAAEVMQKRPGASIE